MSNRSTELTTKSPAKRGLFISKIYFNSFSAWFWLVQAGTLTCRFYRMKCPYKGIGIIRYGKKVSAVRDRKTVHDGLSQPFHPNIGNFLDEVLPATPYKPDRFELLFIITKDGPHLDRFVDFRNHNSTKQLLLIQLPYHCGNLSNDVNIALPLFDNNRFHGWMFWFQLYRI